MLTKTDLKAIKEILDERLDSRLEEKFDKKLKPVGDDIEDIKTKVQPIQTMKKDIKKIKKDVKVMIDMFNKDDARIIKRVRKIEEHLHLAAE